MNLHEIITEVCTDLETANQLAETVGYGKWAANEDGTATVPVKTYDRETGDITGTYTLRLTLTPNE